MNSLFPEHNYHNVEIGMFVKVNKDEFELKTPEPEKNTEWKWLHWDQFMQKEPKFLSFKFFFEQGFDSLAQIKATVGL